MKFNIERVYLLPYEKDVCIDWLSKNVTHGLQEPSDKDLEWEELLNKGKVAELEDLVNFSLTPSVWFKNLRHRRYIDLTTCLNWLKVSYDDVVLEAWNTWLLNEINNLLEGRDSLSNKSITWLERLQVTHFNGAANALGLPIAYHHGTFTRTIQFNLEYPDPELIPNEYKPTMFLEPSDLKDIEAFCVTGLAENIN